jgi:hypothetical protein
MLVMLLLHLVVAVVVLEVTAFQQVLQVVLVVVDKY